MAKDKEVRLDHIIRPGQSGVLFPVRRPSMKGSSAEEVAQYAPPASLPAQIEHRGKLHTLFMKVKTA
jgi:hypothetical protein